MINFNKDLNLKFSDYPELKEMINEIEEFKSKKEINELIELDQISSI